METREDRDKEADKMAKILGDGFDCDEFECQKKAKFACVAGQYCEDHIDLHKYPALKQAPLPDMINSPPHYQSPSGLEAIDVIEAFDLDRYRAAAVKYILRADKKGGEEDLKKAIWYLKRKIQHDRMPPVKWMNSTKEKE